MKNGLSRYPLKTVFRRLHDMLAYRNRPPRQSDAVLFMGDATSYGDLDSYRDCMSFFSECLQLGSGRIHQHIPVGILPGNHDINRALLDVPGSDQRFSSLNKILVALGLPTMPVHELKEINLETGNCRVKVHLLNSCIGCGLKKHIPAAFRKALSDGISGAIGADKTSEALKQYFDLQLDTPAIEQVTIEGLSQSIRDCADNEMVIVAAHHNLLPQRSLRIAAYTELVNGGVVRDMLLHTKRPIIYLHGHIHDDPVEIVKSIDGYPVLIVSSPRIDEGFNIIEIVYDRTGKPLCCNVIPYRFQKNMTFERADEIRVPLVAPERAYLNSSLAKTYSVVLSLHVARLKEIQENLSPDQTVDEIVEHVELLAASGLALIKGYGSKPEDWIIEGFTR
jgi:Calcineurin-like phosphoesterase